MTSKNDILTSVREKLLAEGIEHLAEVPQDLNAGLKKRSALIGAAFSTSAGASATRRGFDVTVPVAVVIGIVGYFDTKAGS